MLTWEEQAMDEHRKEKILVIGDGAAPTGFARVVDSILVRLTKSYDIKQLIPYHVDVADIPRDWPWQHFSVDHGSNLGGDKPIDSLLDDLKPELIFIVNDMHVIRKYILLLDPWRKGHDVKLIAYCPIDLTPLPLELVKPLRDLDALVTYTDFGRRVIEHSFTQLNTGGSISSAPEVQVIPHGIDTGAFFPVNSDITSASGIPDRKQARRSLFGEDVEDYLDSFIVLNANRNQPRKRIDLTIASFSLFARDKPANVFLYLHMGLKDLGWDIEELCKRHGIHQRLIVSSNKAAPPFLEDERLNLIYNACDVGVNTAVAEGWGLVSFEHAATGAAQIVPCHAALAELWEGSAAAVYPRFILTDPKGLFEEHFVAPQDVAASLENLYRDPVHLRQMSLKAYQNATQPKYSWDIIAETWKRLFDHHLNRA
jgi:glycosyltransferase involved in cell wall biosynthesis